MRALIVLVCALGLFVGAGCSDKPTKKDNPGTITEPKDSTEETHPVQQEPSQAEQEPAVSVAAAADVKEAPENVDQKAVRVPMPEIMPGEIVGVTACRGLYFAVRDNNVSETKNWLKRCKPYHVVLKNGATPLMVAAALGNLEMVQILLGAGAELHKEQKASAGKGTALTYALANGHVEVAEYLKQKGAIKGKIQVHAYAAQKVQGWEMAEWARFLRRGTEKDLNQAVLKAASVAGKPVSEGEGFELGRTKKFSILGHALLAASRAAQVESVQFLMIHAYEYLSRPEMLEAFYTARAGASACDRVAYWPSLGFKEPAVSQKMEPCDVAQGASQPHKRVEAMLVAFMARGESLDTLMGAGDTAALTLGMDFGAFVYEYTQLRKQHYPRSF